MAWNEYRLSDVVHLIGGGTPKTSNPDYWGGDIPWLSVGDLNNGYRRVYKAEKSITEKGLQESSTKILRKGQLIISARGTVGVIAQLGREMAFNQTCYGIDAKPDKTTNDFLYYLVKNSVNRLKQITHGAIFDTITRETFNHISVKLPPLSEQKAIASILGALDDKIELNRKMNETLEAMARALFKSRFVDFDPIPCLGPHKEWQDSLLGKIPKGWRVEKVSEAFEINPSRSIKRGLSYAYVDMASLPTISARVTNVVRREFTGSGSKFKNGDVLFARITPCLENGKTALVDFLSEDEYGWGSTEFIVLSPKQPLNMWFVYCVARNQEFRNHAIRAMSGTSGRQRVEIGCFNNFLIVIPPGETAGRFGDIVSPWFSQIKANDEQSHTFASIRDALLPKLLSGEIRVKEAERFVEKTIDTVKTEKIMPLRPKKIREATPEFKEAILIAAIVRGLATKAYPLGRFRYTKISYFVHRKTNHDVTAQYLKKAAGPYNPNTRYKGPEKIAIKNNYITQHKHGSLSGYIAGLKVNDIDIYIDRYGYKDAVKWAIETLKYKSNDDLELLATVDLAALELKAKSKAATADSIRRFISNEKEWKNKLKKDLFSSKNIQRVLHKLSGLFL